MVFTDSFPVHIHRRSIGKSKPQGDGMSDRIMSPDGKHMWTGSEWIPAPPNDNQDLMSNEESHHLDDTKQLLSSEQLKVDGISTTSNISDTVIMGDYNIHQNIQSNSDIENYMRTMIDAYKESRTERAVEIFELAKKIDYELAISLYNGKYRNEVSKYRSVGLVNEIHLINEETKYSDFLDTAEFKLGKMKEQQKRFKSLIRKAEELYQFDGKSLHIAELFYEIWKHKPNIVLFTGGRYSNRYWLPDQFLECGESQKSQQIINEIEQRYRDEMVNKALVLFVIGASCLVILIMAFAAW